MKILILSFYYYPDLCAGSFRCTALVEQLKRRMGGQYDLEVITTAPNRYATYEVVASELEQQENLLIRRIRLPKHQSGILDQAKAFVYFAQQVLRLTKQKKYALVFSTSSRLMTAVLGAWVAHRCKTKLYLDIRDLFVDTIKEVFPRKISLLAQPIFSYLEKLSFRRADRINLVSQGFIPYFNKHYPGFELCGFTNGVDPEFILPIHETDAVPDQPLTVLYAGNIGEGQGLHLIIPCLAKQLAGQVQFRIIGDGGRVFQLEEAISGLTNVTLLPPINRQELIEAYQQADILFLHLNDYEAFQKVLPSKLFEYAAMGKPIWAGVSGYAAEFISSEIVNAVVFTPCDAEEALLKFSSLNLLTKSRTAFVKKYTRETIMSSMAKDMITLIL